MNISGMQKFILALLFLFTSCNSLRKVTAKAEEEHNALYKQKALIVYDIKKNKVLLTTPTCTRCYFLKGSSFVGKWSEGDTMIIDNNLADFYNLHFSKCRTN